MQNWIAIAHEADNFYHSALIWSLYQKALHKQIYPQRSEHKIFHLNKQLSEKNQNEHH